MQGFKQFLVESTLPDGYGPTTSRTKFQEGDLVVTKPSGSWKTMQPKKSHPYFYKAGKVVGYRNVPGAYSKFAIEFPDGVIHPFHGHYVFGPFKDLQTAQKYEKKDPNSIKPEELSLKVGVLPELAKSERVEDALKKLFTSSLFNFNWLKEPKSFQVDSTQTIFTVLAICPIANTPFFTAANGPVNKRKLPHLHIDDGSTAHSTITTSTIIGQGENTNKEFQNLLNNNFVVMRCNSPRDRRLKNFKSSSTFLDYDKYRLLKSPYLFSYANIDQYIMYNVAKLAKYTPEDLVKNQALIETGYFNIDTTTVSIFDKYPEKIKALHGLASSDVKSVITSYYKTGDPKLIDVNKEDEISIDHGTFYMSDLNAEFFKDYTICQSLHYYTRTGNIIMPKKVKGAITIIGIKNNDINLDTIEQYIDTSIPLTDSNKNDYPTIVDFSFLKNIDYPNGKQFGNVFSIYNVNVPKVENFSNNITFIHIENCNLKNLYGLPEKIQTLRVNNNQLTTLEGDVKKISGDLELYNNPITTFEGLPEAGNYLAEEETLQKLKKYKELKSLGVSKDVEDTFKDFYT